jgi:hypothetical protein
MQKASVVSQEGASGGCTDERGVGEVCEGLSRVVGLRGYPPHKLLAGWSEKPPQEIVVESGGEPTDKSLVGFDESDRPGDMIDG